MQAEPHATRSSGATAILLRTAAAAGLFEALAVGIDATASGSAGGVTALAYGAAFVAIQVGLWWLLALPLRGLDAPGRVLRVVASLWAIAVLAGRWLFGEGLEPGAVAAALAGVALLHLIPIARLRDGDLVGELAAQAAVFAIGVASLRGLLRSPLPEAAVFAVAAAVAFLLASSVRRWPWALPGVAIAALLAAWLSPTASAPAAGPNVLWILVDTLRRDHVEPYGTAVRSPALARFSAGGVRFDDAVTVVPKTPASVASLLTGLLPQNHGVRTLYDALPEARSTAAEIFSGAGWRTAALVQNGWLSMPRGFGQGFGRFWGHADLNAGWGLFDRFSWLRLVDQLTTRRIPRFDPQTDSEVLTRAAARQLEAWSVGPPFFLYVHYFEPHWPYRPPAEHARRNGAPEDADTDVNRVPFGDVSRGRMIFDNPLPEAENEAARRLYRAEVDHTLESVGHLLDALDRLGLAEDTLVVFTADHGHSLGEHDYHFHHGAFLYEPELRIPLILRWPRKLEAGRVVPEPVRSIDLLPTLLELAGLPAPPELDGSSLAPLLRGETEASRPAYVESDVKMFAENTRREVRGVTGVIRGLRTDRYKLLLHATRSGPRFELFDLESDPGEQRDLSGDPAYGRVLASLREQLLANVAPGERDAIGSVAPPDASAPIDREALEQLRALGYVE